MRVKLLEGERAGDVIEVEDSVGHAFVVSGQAEEVASEASEVAEAAETPEDPKKPVAGRKRTAADRPETR